MTQLTMRRLHLAEPDAREQLSILRHQLGAQGNVVSARGRELTRKVFGEELPPIRVVERICAEVRSRGIEAVLHYTEQFDRAQLAPEAVRVSSAELTEAWGSADSAFLETIRRV